MRDLMSAEQREMNALKIFKNQLKANPMSITQNVLIVEDNLGDVVWVKKALETSEKIKFVCFHVSTLEAAKNFLTHEKVDLILLDLGLPDSRGLETFHTLNPLSASKPIVVLTGFSDEESAILAIEAGAQDYLVKGEWSPSQLQRSLMYALRRKNKAQNQTDDVMPHHYVPITKDLCVNLTTQTLETHNSLANGQVETLPLTPFELKLLVFLVQHSEEVISRTQILDHLKGPNHGRLTERTIDVHISLLKQKSKIIREIIQSVYGSGYIFRRSNNH